MPRNQKGSTTRRGSVQVQVFLRPQSTMCLKSIVEKHLHQHYVLEKYNSAANPLTADCPQPLFASPYFLEFCKLWAQKCGNAFGLFCGFSWFVDGCSIILWVSNYSKIANFDSWTYCNTFWMICGTSRK